MTASGHQRRSVKFSDIFITVCYGDIKLIAVNEI